MSNRLIHETSPYLLQHAHNPVDWYPWGEEAFAEARRRNVPVLLSIGYAACHWCHVMERESFENPVVAARMNDAFVNVKVDREERPDLDDLYMRAVQAFNRGTGGWPMTVFLTPEAVPFFGGTYYPPVSRAGMPGFVDVLAHVAETFREKPGDVGAVTEQILEFLQQTSAGGSPSRLLARAWLEPIFEAAAEDYDPVEGGFGTVPKFPPHGTLAVLIAHVRRATDLHALAMVRHTLDGMAKGGMYDLLAGGFCRYSVDGAWRIPHFEKMLYDNAQLIPLYVDAWKITGEPRYARIARETVGFVLRDLGLPGGGFASSLDADTEGVEGSTYVFTPEDLEGILGDDAPRVGDLLEVTAEGSFEHGTSVLRLEVPLEALDPAERALLATALPQLKEARDARPQPARDDKRIVAWNALAISALARGATALDEPGWLAAAIEAWDFLSENAVVDGRWMRTWRDDRAHVPAFADDYANLLSAALDLWEATFDPVWLVRIETLADTLVRLFWDESEGALFLVGNDQPPLVTRSRVGIGGAEPGALGMGALGLVRAARLLARPRWSEIAERLVRSAQSHLGRAPRALGIEALAGAWLAEGGAEIAIVGRADSPDTRALLAEVRRRVLPFSVIVRLDPERAWPEGTPPLPWVEGKTAIGGRATAYLCEGHSCQLPTPDPTTFGSQLEERMTRASAVSATIGVRVRAPELPLDPAVWLGTDTPLSLAKLRGSVVVLDFWTYCCINCLHVLPELAALEERYAGQPVVVIGVHCAKFSAEEIADNVRLAITRYGIRHPVIHDPEHAVWEEYTVRSWPTVVVIDAEGKIAHQQGGEVGRDELARVIDTLLGEARQKGALAATPIAFGSRPDGSSADRVAAYARGSLRFPGKVHVWPDAFEQEMDRDSFDGTGRLYVADTGHHQIVECDLDGGTDGWPVVRVMRRFGSGEPGLVDGPAETAQFRGPQGIRRHEDTLYVADTENHALRAVDLVTGEVRTLAGTGVRGRTAPTREALAQPLKLDLRSPWDVDVMQLRNHHLVFLAMAGSHQIWVYGAGHLGIHAGSGREDHVDGPSSSAALAQPSGLAMLGRYLLFADSETSSIRAVDLQSHQVVTVVGRGLFDFGDVDGRGDNVRLQHPLGLTFAGEHVYVADTYNHKIKAVALQTGDTRTLVGGDPSVLREPGGIARAGDYLVVADTNNHRLRVVSIDTGEIRDLPIE